MKKMMRGPKNIGYARISTKEQDIDMQLDALANAGCERKYIFTDTISGAKSERVSLQKCIEQLQAGDTLIVRCLDRLGRSMKYLVTLIDDIKERGVAFKSICDGFIDTTTALLCARYFSPPAPDEKSTLY